MAKPRISFGPKFLDSLVDLPKDVLSKLIKCLELFSRNPRHPSLNVERLQGRAEGLYSARVDLRYRLVFAQPSEEDVRLLFVGTHDKAYEFAEAPVSHVLGEIRAASTPVDKQDIEPFLRLPSVKTRKYLPLSRHLMGQPASVSRLDMAFEDVERAVGDRLPPSARKFPAWWANDHTRHVQASAWLGVGWKTENVRFAHERLCFVRIGKATTAAQQ